MRKIKLRILDRFRKKKKEKAEEEEAEEIITDLEKLCVNDKEAYEALREIMLLDPRKIGVSMKEVAQKAEGLEKSDDAREAVIWYQTAGGLAIYEGDIAKVKQYFAKCQELSKISYPILKVPEKAVAKAQEYYKKYLKEGEEK